MVARLGDSVTFYKIGMELDLCRRACAGASVWSGRQERLHRSQAARHRQHRGARGVGSIARLGARFLTVHAYPQTMKAALAGGAGSDLEDPGGHGADLL